MPQCCVKIKNTSEVLLREDNGKKFNYKGSPAGNAAG